MGKPVLSVFISWKTGTMLGLYGFFCDGGMLPIFSWGDFGDQKAGTGRGSMPSVHNSSLRWKKIFDRWMVHDGP